MTRLTAAAVAAIVSLWSIGGRAQPAQHQHPRVVIDAVAYDKTGSPVLDLKPDEVEVSIGHFKVPIRAMTAVTPASDQNGRLIVLLLDDTTVPFGRVQRVREVAKLFVSRMLPGDRIAVVTLDGSSTETTDEPARLDSAIDHYDARAGFTTMDVLGQHVLETIASLAQQMTEAPGRRKTIVGIGSGWVFDRPIPPPFAGRDLRPEWTKAMRAMAFAHANLYAIDPTGVGATGAYPGDQGFARETGGYAFVNTNDFKTVVTRILSESENYYLMAVDDPPSGQTAPLRELEVRSLRRGVTMRARHAIPGK
ncbi:MAG: VWA domain-containing protein [Vicinamibacterales bacterium]